MMVLDGNKDSLSQGTQTSQECRMWLPKDGLACGEHVGVGGGLFSLSSPRGQGMQSSWDSIFKDLFWLVSRNSLKQR